MDAKQFIASLPKFDDISPRRDLTKEQVFDAAIRLPVPAGFTGRLAVVRLRRPYHDRTSLVTVCVSRLPAP